MSDNMPNVKRIAITGCTGSIGTALIRLCIEQGIEVCAFVRGNSKRVDRIPKHSLVNIVECDLSELSEFDAQSCPKCDVFYHLGWGATIGGGRNDMPTQIDNIRYTIDAVTLANELGCHTFVGTGSQAEYGRFEGKLNADVFVNPENGYGIAKLAAGHMSRIECGKYGMKHIWTRILSVYGPGDSELTMVSQLISKLLKGEKPSLTKGEQQWDYLYVDDAARALYLLGSKGKDGQIYCIGSGVAHPLISYIEQIRDAVNPGAELGVGEVPYGEKQVMYLCADISKLTEDTGFVPQISFKDGIKKTVEWWKEKGING